MKPLSPIAQRPARKAGFTLVEVALAMGVAAVAIMSLLAMAAMGLRMGRLAVDETITATIAQDLLTDLRTQDFPLADDEQTFDRDGAPSGSAAHYKCQVQILEQNNHLAVVQLTLVWPNIDNFAAAPNTNKFLAKIANHNPY